MRRNVPAHDLVRNVPDVLKLEKVAVGLEDFLEVAVAEFGDQVDLGKVLQVLVFGNDHVDHLHNVRMLTVLEEDELP